MLFFILFCQSGQKKSLNLIVKGIVSFEDDYSAIDLFIANNKTCELLFEKEYTKIQGNLLFVIAIYLD